MCIRFKKTIKKFLYPHFRGSYFKNRQFHNVFFNFREIIQNKKLFGDLLVYVTLLRKKQMKKLKTEQNKTKSYFIFLEYPFDKT